MTNELRFQHAYGRLALREPDDERYVFLWGHRGGHEKGYQQARNHGKFAPGNGRQEAEVGKPGSGERISVSRDEHGYHMRHTRTGADGSESVLHEIHGNKGLSGMRTLRHINNYAQRHGVARGERNRLTPADFRASVFRAAAARGRAEAEGRGGSHESGPEAMGHLGHRIGGLVGGHLIGGTIGGLVGRGVGEALQALQNHADHQQHSESVLRFSGTYGRMSASATHPL